MPCVSENSLQMFVDNELEAPESSAVAGHLRECPSCSREIANVVRLKRATHVAGQRFTPSAPFQRTMMSQLSGRKPQRWWTRAMIAIPAAALVALFAVSLVLVSREQAADSGRELADLHVATLAAANPVDVVSSDMHTVKPWFAGKLPFTFNIPELKGSEYELIGGRMAYFEGAPAAQLVFKYRQHRASVFIVEESAIRRTAARAPANFTVIDWRANGLAYFLVTDSSPSTMHDLVERLKVAAKSS